ncbi:MAG: NADPH-dependent F420 reductase [Actinomycetota bacterium]
MNVAIIGAGSMGGGFARALVGKHHVAIGSRDPERGAALAKELGAARGGSYADVAKDADVVFLTVPWVSVEETLPQLGDLTGKVLVDVTNPYVEGKIRLHEGTSDAELIQGQVPGARVIKGWNTIFSRVVNESPDFGGQAAAVFLAGDDAQAKQAVAELARDMGYDPVDCGSLANARALEHLLSLLGTIGHSYEWGTWALKVLHR